MVSDSGIFSGIRVLIQISKPPVFSLQPNDLLSDNCQIEFCLARGNLKEDRRISEFGKEATIALPGCIPVIGGMVVEDDSLAGESVRGDGFQREQAMVQGSKTIPDHKKNGKGHVLGKVRGGVTGGEGNEPSTNSFDKKRVTGPVESFKNFQDGAWIEDSTFESGRLNRGEGSGE